MTAYAASKAGLIGLMQVLAAEFGAQGIRVNALLPGGTDTPASITNAPGAGPEVLAFVEGLHALKRMAKPGGDRPVGALSRLRRVELHHRHRAARRWRRVDQPDMMMRRRGRSARLRPRHLHVGQEDGEQPEQRQERADPEDVVDALVVGDHAEQRRPMPPTPKAKPKKMPAIMPTRPGTSSCANTTIAEKADDRIRPMMHVRMLVQNRSA